MRLGREHQDVCLSVLGWTKKEVEGVGGGGGCTVSK